MKKNYFLLFLILWSTYSIAQTTPGEYDINILESNSKNSDFGPAYQNSTKVIFASARGGGKKWANKEPYLDLFEAKVNEDGSFSTIKKLPSNVNTKEHESSASFAPDGKTVYFSRNNSNFDEKLNDSLINTGKKKDLKLAKKLEKDREKTSYIAIYRATIDFDGKWTNITSLPFNNRNYMVGHPSVSRDGSKLYFASNMPGSYGGSDIFVVDILPNNKYSKPKNLGRKINTLGTEAFPYIDSKNNLYFSSDSRKNGYGGLDIYAVKIYNDNTISESLHLGHPINSEFDDFGYALNNNIDEGYFSSNRDGGIGSDDIYHFTAIVPLKFECTQFLTGTVKSSKKNKPLSKATVLLTTKDGEFLNTTETNNKGVFKFDIPCDKDLKIIARKAKYEEDFEIINTSKTNNEKVTANLVLNPVVICKQEVTGIVQNAKTAKPIPNAFVQIIDKDGKDQYSVNSDKRGNFKVNLPCKSDFKFVASKDKFMNDIRLVKTKKNPKSAIELVLNLKPEIDTTEVKIVRNKVIVNINPIYFELDKATINKEAATELNKVVAIMLKYPNLKIEGGSHTDSRGSAAYNLKLSNRRANSTVNYIIKKGIDPSRITAKGYGETQPVNGCVDGVRCTKEEYSRNRRTEFVILNPEVLGYID